MTLASGGLYVLLYLQDVKIKRSEQYADSILEAADVGIQVIKRRGVIVSVNETFAKMYGSSNAKL